MSSLTTSEKKYLERLLEMQGGFVLDFTDASFGELFNRFKVPIHDRRYHTFGTSKAKKLRAFWEQEDDPLVGAVLSEMLDLYETSCDLNNAEIDNKVLEKCRGIIGRLTGQYSATSIGNEDNFLEKEFTIAKLDRLPVEDQVVAIVEARLEEARIALKAGADLSVIFLCGSVLEGVLLGAAQCSPEKFNRSKAAPTDKDGKVKQHQEWTLAQFIDVACDVKVLSPDVKTFSHGLRDFRNYIHPYQQMISGFQPDEHTSKVCFQVLKAALANLVGERRGK